VLLSFDSDVLASRPARGTAAVQGLFEVMQVAPKKNVARHFASWGAVLAFSTLLSACGGGGGGPSNLNPNPPGPTPTTVTVSGKITFDRIPFDAAAGNGLNPNAPIESPARGVIVEAVAGTSVLATAITSAAGDYSLDVPSNTQIVIRAKAQMLKSDAAPTWNFRVLNNTNSDALYALESAAFSSGATSSTRNLRAASGWGGVSYTGTRAAAPFAVLDTVYQAKELVLSASPAATFPPLALYWSATNKPTSGTFCIDDGDIGVTFYTSGGTDEGECDGQVPEGIYVLGDFSQGDTDEFDQHVLAHEFGHYIEAKFARSDSIGGEHADGNKLDLRVAFGEGWGNAFSGMVLNDPVYRDSYGGAASDFSINMEVDDIRFNDGGWFSETSIAEVLWDIFDATNEGGDSVTLGFAPIFTAMSTGQRNTDALTSIFSFISAIEASASGSTAQIDQLRSAERINSSDEFGVGENNAGGADLSVLPIYKPIVLNDPQQTVCVNAANGADNKLGYIKFFRLDLNPGALVTITVTGAVGGPGTTAAQDPDVFVYRKGNPVASGTGTGPSEVISQRALVAGTYIIEVYDFDLESGIAPRCMTISATGT
jgi:hypothetical protein